MDNINSNIKKLIDSLTNFNFILFMLFVEIGSIYISYINLFIYFYFIHNNLEINGTGNSY